MITAPKVALALSRHAACSLLLLISGRSFAAAQRASAQSQGGSSQYVYSDKPTTPTPPSVLRLCNGPSKSNDPRGCETWIWRDGHYDSVAIQSPTAIITVESFTQDTLVFRLADAAHPGKDGTLKAFMGKISPEGDSILDGMSLAKDGTPGQFRAYWGAALEERAPSTKQQTSSPSPSASMPPLLHWCAGGCNAGRGGSLIWENGRYVDASAGASGAFWTVEKFTRESVIMHRTDKGPYPGTAVITGRLADDGNSIIDGKIEWTYHPCCGPGGGIFKAAWGPAIDTVPGGVSPPQFSQAEQNLGMLQLLFSLFASDGSSGSSDRDKRPSVGCAPGNINPACYH